MYIFLWIICKAGNNNMHVLLIIDKFRHCQTFSPTMYSIYYQNNVHMHNDEHDNNYSIKPIQIHSLQYTEILNS